MQTMDESPALAQEGDVVICKFTPLEPVALEVASKYPALGRFCIRQGANHEGALFAVGLVLSVERLPFQVVRQ